MQFEYSEPWTSFGTTSYASLKELGEINGKAFEKLTEQQLGLVANSVDAVVKQASLVTDSKGYKDLLAGEAKLFTEYSEKLLDAFRKTTEILTDSKDEITAWIEKTIDTTTAPIKKGITPAKKASA